MKLISLYIKRETYENFIRQADAVEGPKRVTVNNYKGHIGLKHGYLDRTCKAIFTLHNEVKMTLRGEASILSAHTKLDNYLDIGFSHKAFENITLTGKGCRTEESKELALALLHDLSEEFEG